MAPNVHLAGLLTCASTNLSGLPRTCVPVTLVCQVLHAYSYGVATDSHRLPEHQIPELYRRGRARVKPHQTVRPKHVSEKCPPLPEIRDLNAHVGRSRGRSFLECRSLSKARTPKTHSWVRRNGFLRRNRSSASPHRPVPASRRSGGVSFGISFGWRPESVTSFIHQGVFRRSAA
jgi:hypothetical protein